MSYYENFSYLYLSFSLIFNIIILFFFIFFKKLFNKKYNKIIIKLGIILGLSGILADFILYEDWWEGGKILVDSFLYGFFIGVSIPIFLIILNHNFFVNFLRKNKNEIINNSLGIFGVFFNFYR